MKKLAQLFLCYFVFTTQNNAQDNTNYNFYDVASWSILTNYDMNDWEFRMPLTNFSIRYEGADPVSIKRKGIFREKNFIYQFDLDYNKKTDIFSLGERFPDSKMTTMGFKIGKNLASIGTNKIKFGVNVFLGAESYNYTSIPVNSMHSKFSKSLYYLNLSSELDFSYNITKSTAVKIVFPIPMLDIGFRKYRDENPNIPSLDQSDTSFGTSTFDFSRKFKLQFGFSKHF